MVSTLDAVTGVGDPCDGVDCGDFGSCDNGTCVCTDGYSGDACDVAPDPCDGVQCGDHGECIEGTCQCEAGWEGALCDEEIVPLEPMAAACDLEALYGFCMGYVGSFYTPDYVELACAEGVYTSTCPEDDALIKCRENTGTEIETLMYYYPSIYNNDGLGISTVQDAIDNCVAKGGTVE